MNWDMNIGPVTAYAKILVVCIWSFVELVFSFPYSIFFWLDVKTEIWFMKFKGNQIDFDK